MNPRITPKERGLLKGAIRKVFARSELREEVIRTSRIQHFDPGRPRVKKWIKCQLCNKPNPEYLAAVDHIEPVIALNSSFEEQGLDLTADRTWCDKKNLQVVCDLCHDIKTKRERQIKKELKNGKRSKTKRSKKTT